MRPWHIVAASFAALTLGTFLDSVALSWLIFVVVLLIVLDLDGRMR